MLAIEYLPNYTYEEYKNWEGDWELIDGIAYAMSPRPMKQHQYILGNIFYQLKIAFQDCKKCLILPEAEWHLSDDTIFIPDIMVVCNESIEGSFVERTPEVIFEILSKSTEKKDKGLKKLKYQEAKVKYYIIVDCESKGFIKYELIENIYIEKELNSFILDDCVMEFDFEGIF